MEVLIDYEMPSRARSYVTAEVPDGVKVLRVVVSKQERVTVQILEPVKPFVCDMCGCPLAEHTEGGGHPEMWTRGYEAGVIAEEKRRQREAERARSGNEGGPEGAGRKHLGEIVVTDEGTCNRRDCWCGGGR